MRRFYRNGQLISAECVTVRGRRSGSTGVIWPGMGSWTPPPAPARVQVASSSADDQAEVPEVSKVQRLTLSGTPATGVTYGASDGSTLLSYEATDGDSLAVAAAALAASASGGYTAEVDPGDSHSVLVTRPGADFTFTDASSGGDAAIAVVTATAFVAGIAGGTGAQTVLLLCQNGDGRPLVQVVKLSGTTPVQTDSDQVAFVRSMIVVVAGSGKAAAGDMAVQALGGGQIYGLISAGTVQMFNAAYRVPANCRAWVPAVRLTAAAANTVRLVSDTDPELGARADGIFYTHAELRVVDGAEQFSPDGAAFGPFAAGSIVALANDTDAALAAEFDIYLERA